MQVTKEVVSVSGMARILGLSRSRFYQLMGEGVFPKPSRSKETGRPFFNREQQEQSIEVRRTNRGINGRAILFYAMRPATPRPQPARAQPRRRQSSSQPTRQQPAHDASISELRYGLTQLGLADVSVQAIRTALADLYPDGHGEVDSSELLRSVFAHLNCQDSHDNLAR